MKTKSFLFRACNDFPPSKAFTCTHLPVASPGSVWAPARPRPRQRALMSYHNIEKFKLSAL